MVYSQVTSNGKSNILTRSFKSGETKTIINSGTYPFATNLRIVFIKSGNTLGFAKMDGISRLLLPLTQPSDPSLSFDSRLICVVDKLPDKYQLIRYDTIGNKTILYETTDEISSPSFSSDGEKIVFTQKKDTNSSSLFLISVTGGTVKRITPSTPGSYDDYSTVQSGNLYFVRSRIIDSTLSSEIFSTDLGGTSITQLSNFTNNWTTPSFFIKNLRKISNDIVGNTSLICVSNYNSTNSDIYIYQIGGSLTKMTETTEQEFFPSLIPNVEK
jgi:Tol biopolymer transport system component